jgi:hypothetical protein
MPRNRVIEWREAIRDSDSLSANARLVAHTLATYMHVDGTHAYPSLDTLAHGCNRGRKRVIAATKELEGAGYLAVIHGGGRTHPNMYAANFPNADSVPADTQQSHLDPVRVSSVPGNGALEVPETGAPSTLEVERNRNRSRRISSDLNVGPIHDRSARLEVFEGRVPENKLDAADTRLGSEEAA